MFRVAPPRKTRPPDHIRVNWPVDASASGLAQVGPGGRHRWAARVQVGQEPARQKAREGYPSHYTSLESVSYQIALFPRLLMTSTVFVGRYVLDTRRHVGPNFVVKWNEIKLESVFYGLVWLFVKIKQFCMIASPLLTYMSTWRHWRRIH